MLKFSVFSTISLIALPLIILLNVFSNLSLYSLIFYSPLFSNIDTQKIFSSISFENVLSSMKEETHNKSKSNFSPVVMQAIQALYIKDSNHLTKGITPPKHATSKERKTWLKANLREFKIITSNEMTQKFESKAEEFFHGSCDVRFFMTWISPVTSLSHREFLAIESVFKAHPSGCLMILSATMDSKDGIQMLKPLTERGYRVAAVSPDLEFMFKDTPADNWFKELKKGNVDPGVIPFGQNLSNLLRLALIYKYGGVYLDTDVIVIKKFSALRNTIGAQSVHENGNWSRLNNAVLIFDKNHPLMFEFIKEFSLTFDGSKWGYNGPLMVSRVAERVLKSSHHYNFTVLPPSAFYPVIWTKIGEFFKRPKNLTESKWVTEKLHQISSGKTYAVHLWNKQSSGLRIEEGSIIESLISEHCLFCNNNM